MRLVMRLVTALVTRNQRSAINYSEISDVVIKIFLARFENQHSVFSDFKLGNSKGVLKMAFRIFGSHIKETWKSKVHVYPLGNHMQLVSRNLSAYDRSILALKLKPAIAAKAKEKEIESGGAVPQKSAKPPIETRQEIAKTAGVSHDTIAKVEKIEAQATPEIKAATPARTLPNQQASRADLLLSRDACANIHYRRY